MGWAVLAVAVGFVALTRGADHFVAGSARLAALLQVSPIVIGALVIGFGTSAPEMLVSGLAAAQGDVDLGVGNVLGSNVANLALVLPVAALLGSVRVDSRTLRSEVPLSMGACIAFLVVLPGGLTRVEGALLALLLVLALARVVVGGRQRGDEALVAEVEELIEHEEAEAGSRLSVEVLRVVLGLGATVAGAQALVWGARVLAEELGLAEGFIGLTLVAVGTSLPELAAAVAAARRGEDELVVGNLLGSNIFNSLAVGAILALVSPGPLADPALAQRATVLLVVVMAATVVAMWGEAVIKRWEASVLLGIYLLGLPFLL
jgi:cation:H+ antiporter